MLELYFTSSNDFLFGGGEQYWYWLNCKQSSWWYVCATLDSFLFYSYTLESYIQEQGFFGWGLLSLSYPRICVYWTVNSLAGTRIVLSLYLCFFSLERHKLEQQQGFFVRILVQTCLFGCLLTRNSLCLWHTPRKGCTSPYYRPNTPGIHW